MYTAFFGLQPDPLKTSPDQRHFCLDKKLIKAATGALSAVVRSLASSAATLKINGAIQAEGSFDHLLIVSD